MIATRTKTREKAVRLFYALSDEMRVLILEQRRNDEQQKSIAARSPY